MVKYNEIVIDGQVYAQRITGQYRYANEILMELDKIISKDTIKIIVPEYVDIEGKFSNLKIVKYGNVKGVLWTQISLAKYLKRNNAISLGFCNTTPIVRPGVSVVHDVGYKVLKDQYKNLYGRCSALWHRLNYYVISKSKYPIITVSEFSKNQLCEIYHVSPERVTVIGNGWQHIERIHEDENIFKEYTNIRKKEYYFALGSLEERKNFKWIIEVAKRNQNEIFVIAGGSVKNNKEKLELDKVPNVIPIGYISDGYVKALMKNCKAFLFPSMFEGFGIPPLEALSVGAHVFCSNAACMPEICGNSVSYFEPYNYDYQFRIEAKEENIDVLEKYSWKQSAESFYKMIVGMKNENKNW